MSQWINASRRLVQRAWPALLAAAAVLPAYTPAVAEDIDLFVQPPGVVTGLPNVLILLDNTANWEDPFTEQMEALATTVDSLAVNDDGSAKFRLGFMFFTETGNPNNNVDGGYIRAAIRDLDRDTKEKYVALIRSLDKNNDKSNGGKAGKAMAEAYQYFSGLDPRTGNSKVKTDYTNNTSGTTASQDIYALGRNAIDSFAGSPYTSPIVSGSCAGNYIIYLSNGPVQDNNADNTTATTWLTSAAAAAGIAGATTQIPISPTGSSSNVANEWARFMKKSPRAITTFTIDVRPKVTGQTAGWTALLKSIASVSDGKYFDGGDGSTGDQVAEAAGRIFSEIQAVNSVFASVSLPVSVNTEGTYLNQVYIGMFRPDQRGLARWAGNLKQYKLGLVGSNLRTLDADNNSAINSSTGFITECARSFWTPTTADAYWAFRPSGGCTFGGANYDNSNYPDGKIVEKGAQAYVLRSSTTRTVRTCSSVFADCSTAGALVDFDSTYATESLLGAASTTERDALISWQKGIDVDNEDIDAVTTGEMRASAHGDVVHSRPLAINHGTVTDAVGTAADVGRKVVVYYASNDGVFRAINGNRSVAFAGAAAGKELWSFVPPEFFGSIKRLRDNNVQISYQGNPTTTPTPQPKPYGMEGAVTAYDKNWLYVGMRRGGRALYAFDVTNITGDLATSTAPVAPRLLWKKGCPNPGNDTDCTSGYEQMGQTWSAARVLKTEGYAVSTVPQPMLIMGGGYDNCEDADPVSDTCKSNGKGHRIYVMDAATGARLKEFTTLRGVVGDVFVINDSATGLAKWAYAADLGGNVYRISGDDPNTPFEDTLPGDWEITRIASLGCSDAGGCTDNRKFMFMPDIVEKNNVYYLLLGSGDREKPLDAWTSAYGTTNYFFMLQDTPTDDDWLSAESDSGRCSDDLLCLDSLLEINAANPDPTALAAKKGWYLALNPHEQVVTSAITVFGTTTFSTHTPVVPVSGACTSNLGTARVYNVRFLNASARVGVDRSAVISGGGLPPSPVAGLVTLDNNRTYPFCIGCDPTSPLESKLPSSPSTGTQPKSLTYWYIEK